MSEHISICKGGWKSSDGVPEHSWRNPVNWYLWPKITRLRVPVRYLNFQKCSEGPLMDNRPTKRFKIEKGRFFNTLTVEIFSIIDHWSIIFEYNYKRTTFINQIIQKKNCS